MKIEYFGHSCFKLTGGGVSIVCDPYSSDIGLSMPKVTADAVTISHRHFDHDAVSSVCGNPVVMEESSAHDVGGVEVKAVKSFHDEVQGAKRGLNTVFKFKMDGVRVCHLGDLGEKPSDSLIKAFSPADVLLIPVGGNYTIDAATAKEYVLKIAPSVVIPMHYRLSGCNVNVEGVEKFLKLFPADCIKEADGNAIEITTDDLNGKTKIIVLRRN